MMMINVYLDDLRPCPQGFVLAKTAEECCILLEECEIHILSLDHDLGLGVPTGYDVTKFMVERRLFPREIYLHTSSTVGRMNMYQLLYRYKPEHVHLLNYPMPFSVLERASKQT
jgi:hypothetical protein